MSERVAFRVDGLHCSDEVALLKREIGRLERVEFLDFDILNARMTVTFDPGVSSRQDIMDAVAAGGFRAMPWEERTEREKGTFWQAHGRLIVTALSGVFLLAGSRRTG